MLPWYPFSALSEELRGGRASSWWNVAETLNVSRYRFYLYHEVTMLVFIWLFHINRNSIRKRLVAFLVSQKSTMLSQRTDLSLHAPKSPPLKSLMAFKLFQLLNEDLWSVCLSLNDVSFTPCLILFTPC